MNFRVKDRVALAIYSLCGLGAALLVAYMGYMLYTGEISARLPLLGYAGTVIGAFAMAVVMLVYSLCMLRLAFRRKPKKDRNSVAVQNNQLGNGEVRISVQALDALVKQAIAGNSEGVADIKTSIVNHDDSISVKIEMGLHGDAHIPNITMLLQSSIKSFIEEYSGIAVRDVSIMVKTIIPVMPQLAIGDNASPEPVVLEAEEQAEIAPPQVQPIEETPAEENVQEEADESVSDAEYEPETAGQPSAYEEAPEAGEQAAYDEEPAEGSGPAEEAEPAAEYAQQPDEAQEEA